MTTFLFMGQLIGLAGSFGPSKSTILSLPVRTIDIGKIAEPGSDGMVVECSDRVVLLSGTDSFSCEASTLPEFILAVDKTVFRLVNKVEYKEYNYFFC